MNILPTGENNQSKSGFVIVVGRPSSGKSTLINALCGAKVSIVSPVPQTTRNTIRGIVTEKRGQIVFLDTPGFHQAEKKMNLRLRSLVLDHIKEADAVLYLVDSTRKPGAEEKEILGIVKESGVPSRVVVSKCDGIDAKPEVVEAFLVAESMKPSLRIHNLVDVTGTGTTGLEALLDELFTLLPEGPAYYPEEFYTDQDPSFRIAEILREAAILNTSKEVPHAIYVEVADLEATSYNEFNQPRGVRARCFIHVERESQKGIVVGKGGANIKRIREHSERELKKLFDYPIRLDLQVKVRPKWRHNDSLLKGLLH